MANENGINSEEADFTEILTRLQAETRYTAFEQTVDYMLEADLLEEQPNILAEARNHLQQEDPRQLYLHFLQDLMVELEGADTREQYRIAQQINDIALAGLGIWQEDLRLSSEGKGLLRVTGKPDWKAIEDHIYQTVFGRYFLEEIYVPPHSELWGTEFPLRISACDASQHRLKLSVPTNHVWASPAIVNNAGGVIKEHIAPKPTWANIAVPKGLRDYEDWVILGPADYAAMDEGDYEWSAKSAMDVGQFFVEETFIFKHGGITATPDVHFRDGRIFPQDKLMNCTLDNRHGQLTREAILRMVSSCETARNTGVIFCGVSKHVELKIYSTLVNWYITKVMGSKKWNPTGKTISDTELMRHLLPSQEFSAKTFNRVLITTPILRRFETTSNLNRRTRKQYANDLERLGKSFHNRSITARDIAEKALNLGVVMFFVGHARTAEQFLPRYEYAVEVSSLHGYTESALGRDVLKLLSALRSATFDVDEDHLWGLEEPITTLVPTPILVAHNVSKQVGSELALDYRQRTLAEFIRRKQSLK